MQTKGKDLKQHGQANSRDELGERRGLAVRFLLGVMRRARVVSAASGSASGEGNKHE